MFIYLSIPCQTHTHTHAYTHTHTHTHTELHTPLAMNHITALFMVYKATATKDERRNVLEI